MNAKLQQLRAELERFGAENDAAVAERPRRMLNITRAKGALLAVLARAEPQWASCVIPVGNGEFLAVRDGART